MFRYFLEKNSILVGIIAGLVIPFVGYAVLLMIFEQLESIGIMSQKGMAPNFRNRTALLIAICLNLLPMQFYRKKIFFQSMRGIVFATIAAVGLWMYLFAGSLFE